MNEYHWVECKYYGECPAFFYGLETHCFHELGCLDYESEPEEEKEK